MRRNGAHGEDDVGAAAYRWVLSLIDCTNTDRKDEERRVDYAAEEEAWKAECELRKQREAGHKWAQEDTQVRRRLLINITQLDRDMQPGQVHH